MDTKTAVTANARRRLRRRSGMTGMGGGDAVIGSYAPQRDIAAKPDEGRDEEEDHESSQNEREGDRTAAPTSQILRRKRRLVHGDAHPKSGPKGAIPIARSAMISAK